MSDPEIILPPGWPQPAGYSNAITASGRVIAISGQIGWNPQTRTIETNDFVEQARQALQNIATVLQAAGGHTSQIVRLTWYITDRTAYLNSLKNLGSAYRSIFGHHYPAMSVVVVAGLLEPRALVEIEATAVEPEPR
jgi:enamine deaminase RidA (YjgF/YER057c/UK114 family)